MLQKLAFLTGSCMVFIFRVFVPLVSRWLSQLVGEIQLPLLQFCLYVVIKIHCTRLWQMCTVLHWNVSCHIYIPTYVSKFGHMDIQTIILSTLMFPLDTSSIELSLCLLFVVLYWSLAITSLALRRVPHPQSGSFSPCSGGWSPPGTKGHPKRSATKQTTVEQRACWKNLRIRTHYRKAGGVWF